MTEEQPKITQPVQPLTLLEERVLLGKYSRREVVKSTGFAVGAALVTAALANPILNWAQNQFVGMVARYERELNTQVRNVQALTGLLDKKFHDEGKRLEANLASGKLAQYEQLGIFEKDEAKKLEECVAKYHRFEEHYKISERLQEFLDRANAKILEIEANESKLPEMLRKPYEAFREAKKAILGGETSVDYRVQLKQKLDSLGKLYDTNEDNRVAQAEVMRTLNRYIDESQNGPPEVRKFLEFVRDQQLAGAKSKTLKQLVESYNAPKEDMVVLRDAIAEAKVTYEQMRKTRICLETLQGDLEKGIARVDQVRSLTEQEFAPKRKEIEAKVGELKAEVDKTIADLKSRGYNIETRQDYVNSGTSSLWASELAERVKNVGTIVAGAYAGLKTLLWRQTGAKKRSYAAALTDAVNRGNVAVNAYNAVVGSTPKVQGPIPLPIAGQITDTHKKPDDKQSVEG